MADKTPSKVREMFDAIAPTYDRLNHLLSFQVDRRWRRKAIASLEPLPQGIYLDLAAGTLDLTLTLTRKEPQATVIPTDFSKVMLLQGKSKVKDFSSVPSLVVGDALRLPFASDSFWGVVIGFGIRNFADLPQGLEEIYRILRPGGKVVILEFSTPRGFLLPKMVRIYNRFILPLAGRLISRHPMAYSYLPETMAQWHSPESLANVLGGAGFSEVGVSLLSGGIAAIHRGAKLPLV